MPKLICPAGLVLDADGMPYAPQYGDVYHSRAGGYAQARGVFLAGNELPQAWAERRSFTILETGFGLGTNFLATWAAWRAQARRPRRLHFVSIELHPFGAADLRAWHGRDPEMAPLGTALAAAWPVATPGMHRLEFDGGQVVLTLVFGDAATVLPNLRLQADAFYLDGFAPARNPDMWSMSVFEGLAKLAAPGATIATYTVAHKVFNGLAAAGFAVRRVPGFGGKQEMLVGRIKAPVAQPGMVQWPQRYALVIGAGIAGVTAADSLAARGWRVTLLDGAAGVARGASSTPAGALHTVLSRDDNRLARFTRAGYLHMDRRLAALPGDWHAACGRIDSVNDVDEEAGAQRAAQLITHLGLPPAFVSAIDAPAASDLAGTRVARGGYWYPRGTWLQAGAYCEAVLARHGGLIELRSACAVAALTRVGDEWTAFDANGVALASAPVAILAAGLDLPRLAGLPAESQILPLQRVRGQLTGLPAHSCRAPRVLVSGEGYCLPPVQGVMWTGASYGPGDVDDTVRGAEHASNLQRLARLLPENPFAEVPPDCAGHVGFRAVAPDRLPLVGAVPELHAASGHGLGRLTTRTSGSALARLPRQPGLYVSGAMASRGLTWAALAGDILASLIDGEPPPVEADLLDAVDPARFLERRLRRGQAR
ncbi:MAG TPA: bifunctional tRNA (5-methylaminomethyl-2-thiouridine)(34)-methyltransferase MnmD/FAD-dependent 5-carboxymethylaminomethyl-2-thiouridine(34) oxidoreductase MnmC [Burkholderiales bacterium]|nr:bifunctional tRNA (5-methylaminomethyl-2-thiouridine)(34)-methyltransferase MnmD/FAD-dependent 5-carboxymethylaminomethyl-2-thiouridine(34) oxidoreductase MnmC [Burkholderiales bacterium]